MNVMSQFDLSGKVAVVQFIRNKTRKRAVSQPGAVKISFSLRTRWRQTSVRD